MSAHPTTRVIARILPDTEDATRHGATSVARRRPRPAQRIASRATSRVTRALSSVLMVALLCLLAFTGLGGSQPATAAFGIPSMEDAAKMICNWSTDPPSASSSATDKMMGGNSIVGLERTAEEQFGIGGMFYSTYDIDLSGCVSGMVPGFLANVSMLGATTVTSLTTSMFTWATGDDLLSSFTDPLNCVIEGCNGQTGLKDALFLQYLTTMVVLGALWGAWNGLFKKRTMQTAQGIVWMLCAAIFGIFFLSNPGLIAERSNQAIASFTDTVTNGVTGMSSASITKEDPCWLPRKADDRGNRMASCAMWKAMSYQPWVMGQFGTGITGDMPGATATIGDRKVDDIRLAQLDGQTLSSGEEDSENTGVWTEVQKSLDSDPPDSVSMKIWKGNDNTHRLGTSTVALVAALCLGVLVILISFSMVVMAVGMILLIMMAPLFLLVGIHPGFGRGIALKWLELLIGTMFKRIVLSAMLAILVSMYQVILATPMAWLQQIALILAVGIGAIVFRKPMLDTLNVVKLGGSSTGMEQGMARQSKQMAGGTVGAIAGGIAGGRIGGLDAMAKGAIKGGISGSRSSPLRAASIGAGAGRRVGNRDASADAKKDKAQQAKNNADDADDVDKANDKTAKSSTKSGPSDTAQRRNAEHSEAQAQDAEWRNEQSTLDEILAGVANEQHQHSEATQRVEKALSNLQDDVDEVIDHVTYNNRNDGDGAGAGVGAAATAAGVGAAGMAPQSPPNPTAQQAGNVPRPMAAPSTAAPLPHSAAGVPGQPVTLPSGPGAPATTPAMAPAARTLPTTPPTAVAAPQQAAPASTAAQQPPQTARPAATPMPRPPGATQPPADNQPPRAGQHSAPPRPQS